MTAYVALLRAVNVGGRQLKMEDLKRIACNNGLDSPRTIIASGNLLFTSSKSESELQEMLETAVTAHMGKPVEVMVRTAKEMADVRAANPFPHLPGNWVYTTFLNQKAPADALAEAKNVTDEQLALGRREIYVAYPGGMGASKLRIPAAAKGTARNMNTVIKLAELLKEMS
jgi:uncharacterized protein (DUF1697 family)